MGPQKTIRPTAKATNVISLPFMRHLPARKRIHGPLALVNRVEETCCLRMVHTALWSRNQSQLQRLSNSRENEVSKLQGLEPLKKMQILDWRSRFSEFNIARRSRNQTQLQRLKPTERNFASAGLKPGPPGRSEILREARRM